MARQKSIARCVVRGITRDTSSEANKTSSIGRVLAAFAALFALYQVPLDKYKPEVFAKLRHDSWSIDEAGYVDSFITEDKKDGAALQTMGDMGFSGSTFFSTQNQRYLVKSIPRHFEHSFFREDLLDPYAEHMTKHLDSALVRICDTLSATHHAIGIPLGLAPSHHIIMENILYGKANHEDENDPKWDSFDLKPTSYFFPERDIASGKLTSEATKSRLADEFDGKMVLTREQSADFLNILERDTKLLQDCNAVDYSLFLVRITTKAKDPFQDPSIVPEEQPFAPPSPPSWRTGVVSPDGNHVFRASILDFFWAKHKMQPKVMTGLIKAWNMIDRQGPMSITTTPEEYRNRFLEMAKELIEIRE
ncbi:phosphatidylinositol-4-phosphate 5-kinase-like protein 3 [Elsinoe australis]|uniref:Phosphatidylinositol-4-phosphate 5-kinase-like protein 3 n=1 Tax=Elsinoe australis TaxID=40998 RepID=A0A4U7APM5_9PEZI|nr:phosphatidylinositol-4-phosphate 5-kinase-like protein 3 [Elsinoe australis]